MNIRVLNLRCLAFSRGPGGFRELREAGRKRFHLSWYISVPVVRSYGKKTGGIFVTVYRIEKYVNICEHIRKMYVRPSILVKSYRL